MQPRTTISVPAVAPLDPPTPAEIDEIVAISDPVLRNLRITDAYHRLALAFPLPRPGANWCAFAVWASKQAGQSIRGEDLMRALERALGNDRELAAIASGGLRWAIRNTLQHPGTRRARVLRVLGQEAFARTADALGRGNRKVFGEIGREFARFLSLCSNPPIPPERLADFLRDVPPGDTPETRGLLRSAFEHLASALLENDHSDRAELLLLANLEIAFHEQARVQPEILEALEAPYTSTAQLGRLLLEALAPKSPRWPRFLRNPLALIIGAGGRLAEAALRSLLRRLITESMITIALPGGVLKLGRELTGEPPECLRAPLNHELRAMLSRLTPAPDDLDGAGASHWSLLRDRMLVIGSFFRLRHEDESLYTPPFTPMQAQALRAGRIPPGPL